MNKDISLFANVNKDCIDVLMQVCCIWKNQETNAKTGEQNRVIATVVHSISPCCCSYNPLPYSSPAPCPHTALSSALKYANFKSYCMSNQ